MEKSVMSDQVEQSSLYEAQKKRKQQNHVSQFSIYNYCRNLSSKVLDQLGYGRIPHPWRVLEHSTKPLNITILSLDNLPLEELFTDLSERLRTAITRDSEDEPQISKHCPMLMLRPLPNLHFAAFRTGGARKYLDEERHWHTQRQALIVFLVDGADADCLIEAREESMMAVWATTSDKGSTCLRVPVLLLVVDGNREGVVKCFIGSKGTHGSGIVDERHILDVDLSNSASLDRSWLALIDLLQRRDRDRITIDEK